MLGNDTETRANGGFAGSYTKIMVESPASRSLRDSYPNQSNPSPLDRRAPLAITVPKFSVSFHDIYVPNGQLNGHVKPPEAIQQAFGKGTWELANADYDPHFPTTATTIRWFLEKGDEINPDILGIINLSTIKKILNIIGEFKISENDKVITPDNLYLYLQGKAEVDFFPGSTQKADALHSVGTAALKKIYSLSIGKKIQLAKIIYQDLKNKNIVLNSTDLNFQKFLEDNNFAGAYQASTLDYYGLVEMNLGANKANQYVTRQTTHVIARSETTKQSPTISHTINVDLQNTSPEKNPNPPIHYGGHYIGYFRIYLPPAATNIELKHSEFLLCNGTNSDYCYQATSSANINQSILENQTPNIYYPPSNTYDPKFTVVNFWHLTLAGQHSSIKLSYTLSPERPCHSRESGNPSDKNLCPYSLTLLKQNGFPHSPQTLNIFGSSYKTTLENNFTYPKGNHRW